MTPSIVSAVLPMNAPAVSATHLAVVIVAFALLTSPAQSQPEQRFPDVIAAKVKVAAPGVFDFDVTVSSPYDTPSRYADGFRVSTTEGKVLGERKLMHDHQTEQPFTRDLYSVKIPDGIAKVVVQARDQKYGYGGKTVEVLLPGR